MEAIETEVYKLIECGFILEEQHPNWVANIVPMMKKNEKIRVCIDFHDLNIACPKDEFLFPITDVMIDNTCSFERIFHGWLFRVQSNQDEPEWWEAYIIQNTIGGIVHSNAVRIEKCGCNLPTCQQHNFPWSSTENGGISEVSCGFAHPCQNKSIVFESAFFTE